MDRGAARTVAVIDPEDAALLGFGSRRSIDEAANKDNATAASARTLRMVPLPFFSLIVAD